jgi:hypothetical protein
MVIAEQSRGGSLIPRTFDLNAHQAKVSIFTIVTSKWVTLGGEGKDEKQS